MTLTTAEKVEIIDKQYAVWNKPSNLPEIDDEQLKSEIIEELEYARSMTATEYLLFKKWSAFQVKFPSRKINTIFGEELQLDDPGLLQRLAKTKNNIWFPQSPDDYLKLKPRLVFTGSSFSSGEIDIFTGNSSNKFKDLQPAKSNLSEEQSFIGLFVSSGERGHNNIGRNLNYLVVDEITGKYLGCIVISSDYLDMKARDEYIGWERESKTKEMIRHTAVGSIIVPTQPFGYNYLGGKLLSLLCLSDEIQQRWESIYGDKLVGITTTSFFGKAKTNGMSQYDNLKHWKKLGNTTGSTSLEPTKKLAGKMLDWLLLRHPKKYFEFFLAKRDNGQPIKRDARNRAILFVYSALKIPRELINSKHERGVYFSPLYTNTNEYLRKEIDENQLIKAFPTDYEYLVGLWQKQAGHRSSKLVEQGKFSFDGLFYDEMLLMDWEQSKKRYLPDIGR